MELLPTVMIRAGHALHKTLGARSEESQKSAYPETAHSSPATKLNLNALASSSDLAVLPKIEYAYDPLPTQPRSTPTPLPNSTSIDRHTSRNSVLLDPLAAGLPYRSTLDCVRASKHWTANLSETIELLDLLAEDDSAADIEVRNGITLTKLAKRALKPGKEQQMTLATHYMFPGADEERIKQIAALTVLYFVFDDKVEETPNDKLRMFRDDFIRRLEGGYSKEDRPKSALQQHIDSLVHDIEAQDASSGGTGGREMLDALKGAFHCVRPNTKEGFPTLSSYLDFRRQNVGADFVIAAAKYAIASPLSPSASSANPRFARFLHLASDHLGLVNDLASYDKELRALNSGETNDMINLVHVIKTVTSLTFTEDAKTVAWKLQCQMEREMVEELEVLGSEIGDEESWFLDAVMATAVGNVMFCMTTGRYGGEVARI